MKFKTLVFTVILSVSSFAYGSSAVSTNSSNQENFNQELMGEAAQVASCDISNPSFCLMKLDTTEFQVQIHNSSMRYLGFDILSDNSHGPNLTKVLESLEITLEDTNLQLSASRSTIAVRGENGGLLPPLFIATIVIKSKTAETIQEILDRLSSEEVSLAIFPVTIP